MAKKGDAKKGADKKKARKKRERVAQARSMAEDAGDSRGIAAAFSAVRTLPAPGRTQAGSWDLHMHSTYSDGSCTVDELIAHARAAGLARIAITDHDALTQLSSIRARSRELGFPVLAGTEVSTRDPRTGRKVHMLAYGLEATPDESAPVERLVAPTRYARTANTLWQAWVLKNQDAEFSGKRISLDELLAVAGESTAVYKQHLMEALTARPYRDPDYQFCYRCWFKGESRAAHDIDYPTPKDAVRAIREQGGTPVLAHAGQTNSWELIPDLVHAGLLGIEVFHPDHGEAERALAIGAAERYGLLVTGGSDYHGKYGAAPAVGTCFVAPEEAASPVEELFEREATLS